MENWTTLELTSPDTCRTFLVDQDRKALYSVKTDEPPNGRPVTSYTYALDYTFASLEWRFLLPDRLQLVADGEESSVKNWLKIEKVRRDIDNRKGK